MSIYWQDDQVTLHLGDCRELTVWLAADVLVTDPPYGRGWDRRRGSTWANPAKRPNAYVMPATRPCTIDGDKDTSIRDWVLAQWPHPAAVFGDLMLAPPTGTRKVLIYRKPPDSGTHGALAGFRHDVEAIYLLGQWPAGVGGRSSVIETGARVQGSNYGPSARYGHPHAKPVDVMETLISECPPGVIADPFAGSGSTLIAARNQGRRAVGVELEERYCERAARRLEQGALGFGGAA